eukprot:494063-Prymnesium_polylepis.1
MGSVLKKTECFIRTNATWTIPDHRLPSAPSERRRTGSHAWARRVRLTTRGTDAGTACRAYRDVCYQGRACEWQPMCSWCIDAGAELWQGDASARAPAGAAE